MAKQKSRRSFWGGLDQRERMYLVLALCCAAVVITVVVAFLIAWGVPQGSSEAPSDSASSDSTLVEDSGYNKDENSIDTTQYSGTVLQQSEDAGQSYVDETLFLGDSNTARMYRMFDYCSYDNAIGSVGMSAKSLASYACVQFSGYSGYKTMPEAVALMQPKRVILTFGTNDLSPSYSAEEFTKAYSEGIEAIVEAYPSVDIIVNSIPPLGKQHSNSQLTQKQVDEYNNALVQMCRDHDWKFLNSAETLKDSSTGYAKSGYVESSDGIHLTSAAMDALFEYIRTHSYITDDDRPTVTNVPKHTGDKDVSVMPTVAATNPPVQATNPPADSEQDSSEPEWVEPQATAEPTVQPTEAPASSITYTYWDEVVAPTCTEQGYTIHHCNEDSSKDYRDNYVNATGHNYVNGVCTVCGATDPSYAVPSEPSSDSSSSSVDSASSDTSSAEPNWADSPATEQP
ncbi:MAG: GDSL-type esterase/lipase family protein [Gemmiger sp.]|uniref:SGNH/GDSL hydrolase family protein n=1 Tax=Gemmiger sp. TaxID=2049027 RepID=UPI002E778BE8|nr:GDSL-type esterase/lipase family protein [Gemmiger sp.]MEE0800853.1 GDSL-type esterase/lipase family protein [Gemmiger sp.]